MKEVIRRNRETKKRRIQKALNEAKDEKQLKKELYEIVKDEPLQG